MWLLSCHRDFCTVAVSRLMLRLSATWFPGPKEIQNILQKKDFHHRRLQSTFPERHILRQMTQIRVYKLSGLVSRAAAEIFQWAELPLLHLAFLFHTLVFTHARGHP